MMKFKGLTTKGALKVSREIDKRLRYDGSRTTRDAARLVFKIGERKEDKIAKLQAEIDELREAIEGNRETLKYNEAIGRLEELKSELEGVTKSDGSDD